MTSPTDAMRAVTRTLQGETPLGGHGNRPAVQQSPLDHVTPSGSARVVAQPVGKGSRATVTCYVPPTASLPTLTDTFDMNVLAARKRFCKELPTPVTEPIRGEVDEILIAFGYALLTRASAREDEGPGADDEVPWEVTNPWPSPVDGADVLDRVQLHIQDVLVLPPHGAVILALWIAHTWAVRAFRVTPYLLVESPTKMCGKTRTLDLLAKLAARPVKGSSFSVPVIFHYIEHHLATFLLDELDATLANPAYAGELTGLLNEGSAKGGRTGRMRGEGAAMKPKLFSVFGPKALAGIGRNLQDATRSRCIRLRLHRATTAELAYLPEGGWNTLDADAPDLRAQLARWADDVHDTLEAAHPVLPKGLTHRTAENWTALIAIADAACGHWPTLARVAAAAAVTGVQEEDDDAVTLLCDLRAVFDTRPGMHGLTVAELIEGLIGVNGRWAEYRQGKPITPHSLARLLKDRFQLVRIETRGPDRERLWLRADFEPLFKRYVEKEAGQVGEAGNRDTSTTHYPASPGQPASVAGAHENREPQKTREIERDGRTIKQVLRLTAHGDRWFDAASP